MLRRLSSFLLIAPALLSCESPARDARAQDLSPDRIVLSGQSNAVALMPQLEMLYQHLEFSGRGSQSISYWDEDAEGWQALRPLLRRPLRAFVWWQGENDAFFNTPDYKDKLVALVSRVREAVGDPLLLVVIVRLTDIPQASLPPTAAWTRVREIQEAVAAADAATVMVSSDGLGASGADVPPSKLPEMAQRVLDAIERYRTESAAPAPL